MENPAPFEILAAPFTAYVAPSGTAFPALNAAPGVDWVLIGSFGDLNYTDDGVTVEHSQSVAPWRAAGSVGPRKMLRTEEDMKVSFTVADLTLEQYANAIENAITTVAPGVGVVGEKKIGLSRGIAVKVHALLLRGPSPYMEDGVAQYEVPLCSQGGQPKIVLRKSEPAGLALEFDGIEDPDAATPDEKFGRFRAQTAAAL